MLVEGFAVPLRVSEQDREIMSFRLIVIGRLIEGKRMACNVYMHVFCPMCDQEPEAAGHLALRCCQIKEVWHRFHDLYPRVYNKTSYDCLGPPPAF